MVLAFFWIRCGFSQAAPAKLQVLIITGQNGHDWRAVTPELIAVDGKGETIAGLDMTRELDEATANIDSFTEQAIQKALKVLFAGRTCMVMCRRSCRSSSVNTTSTRSRPNTSTQCITCLTQLWSSSHVERKEGGLPASPV